MAILGAVGAVYMQTDAAAVAFTDEATTGDAGHLRYQIDDTTMRYWDRATTITVDADAVLVDADDYTIEYLSGYIVFAVARGGAEVITVCGAYVTLAQLGGVFGWSLEISSAAAECTTLSSNSWRENIAGVVGFQGSVEAYWLNGDVLGLLTSDTELVFLLYTDAGVSLQRYEGFGHLTTDGVKLAVDAVTQEPLEFQGTDVLYYREA